MSFGEFYGAVAGLGDAYRKGLDEYEAPDILRQLLANQPVAQNGLTALGSNAPAQAQNGLAALGAGSSGARLPSFAGGGSAPMTLPTGTNKEIEGQFIGALRDGGLTNPNGLAAAAAYANRESRYSPQNIVGSWSDPSQSGQPGTSGGILSWRADRLANMRAATAGAKDPVRAQAQFFLTENPDVTLALQNAQSPEEANDILAQAWKFAGYNKPGGEYAARLGTTRAYLSRVAGMDPGQAAAPPQPPVQGLNPGRPQQPAPVGRQTVQFADNEGEVQRLELQMQMLPQQFVIPGSDFGAQARSLPSSDPNARSAPAAAQVGLPGTTVAAQRGLDPALLARALSNTITAPFASAVVGSQLKSGDDYAFTAVGDQFYRTNRRTGAVELVPGVTKPQTTTVAPGSYLVDQVTGRPIFGAPDKPTAVAAGSTLVDPTTHQPLFTAPEKSSKPSFVQMNGRMLLTDPDTGTARDVTPQDLPTGYRPASDQERQAYGAKDDVPLVIGPDGKPSTLGGQTINVGGAEKAQDAKIGGAYGDTFNEMQAAGRSAVGQLNTLRYMEKLIDNPSFRSGFGSAGYTQMQRAATAFGIKDADAAAPNELFQKLATQSLVDKLGGSLGAGVSNSDVATINRTVANLENTPEGNRQIIQFGKALAQRQIEVAKLARQYASGHGGRLDAGFDDQLAGWAEKNPLGLELTTMQRARQAQEGAAGRTPAPSAAPAPPPAAVPTGAPQGTRQAPDGKFYAPDPSRPGHYLEVR